MQVLWRHLKCSAEPNTAILDQMCFARVKNRATLAQPMRHSLPGNPTVLGFTEVVAPHRKGWYSPFSWGPRKVVRLFGERRSSGMYELSGSRGSEGIRACDDARRTPQQAGKKYIFPPPRADKSSRTQVTSRPLKPLVTKMLQFTA